MTAILKPKLRTAITPRIVTLSPYELYLEQVRGISDRIRFTGKGLDYIPPQFGGLLGQLDSLNSQAVVQLVDFENHEK